jgi:hypothetical protein
METKILSLVKELPEQKRAELLQFLRQGMRMGFGDAVAVYLGGEIGLLSIDGENICVTIQNCPCEMRICDLLGVYENE